MKSICENHLRAPPVEGTPFYVSATEVAGTAEFRAYLNGEVFWGHGCPDPPCHEQISIPEGLAGSTLLLMVKDNREDSSLFPLVKKVVSLCVFVSSLAIC
jgi:hypothetical protein